MKPLSLFGLLVASAAVVALILPEEFKERSSAQLRRLRSDSGQACFEYERTKLKDPYSARYDGNSTVSADGKTVTIRYHAKNSYGAYSPGEALCALEKGVFDSNRTPVERVLQGLDAKAVCLEASNKLMREGKWSEAKALNCGTD